MSPLSFEEYVASLSQLSLPFDPTLPTAQSEEIREAAARLSELTTIDRSALAAFVQENPSAVPILGLAVGLTREKLKNVLRHRLAGSWTVLARTRPEELIDVLDEDYEVVRLVSEQRGRGYDFGDILVARSGTRRTASTAGQTGRRVENEIEQVAASLGLPYETRTRFKGRGDQTAPCDLVIPAGGDAARIVVAAKGFDSTGSKLSDAVREVEEMAEKRLPSQYVMAAIDGIGWKSRLSDLRRIIQLRSSNRIDGLYTLSALGDFREDLKAAADRLGIERK